MEGNWAVHFIRMKYILRLNNVITVQKEG